MGSVASLGRGDFEDAYQHATAISPQRARPGLPRPARPVGCSWTWSRPPSRTGRHTEAAAHVTAMRDACHRRDLAQRLAGRRVRGDHRPDMKPRSRAIREAPRRSRRLRLPFDLARVRLCYGERLRRARATTGSRAQLTAALEIFGRPSVPGRGPPGPAGELRAAGRTHPRADPAGTRPA